MTAPIAPPPTYMTLHLGETVDLKEPGRLSSYQSSFTGTVTGLKPDQHGDYYYVVTDSEDNAFDVSHEEIEHFHEDNYERPSSRSPDSMGLTRHFVVTINEVFGDNEVKHKMLATLCGHPSKDDWKIKSQILMGWRDMPEIDSKRGVIFFRNGTSVINSEVDKEQVTGKAFDTLREHLPVKMNESDLDCGVDYVVYGFDYQEYIANIDEKANRIVTPALFELNRELQVCVTQDLCDEALDFFNMHIDKKLNHEPISTRIKALANILADHIFLKGGYNIGRAREHIGLWAVTDKINPKTGHAISGEIVDIDVCYKVPRYVIEASDGTKVKLSWRGLDLSDDNCLTNQKDRHMGLAN